MCRPCVYIVPLRNFYIQKGLMKIRCIGIVHYEDGVVLVRDKGADQWRLPERVLADTEDILLCIRRAVLQQTGFRTLMLRFYKIYTQIRTTKQGAQLNFVFGCEIGDTRLQQPEIEAQRFTPDEVMALAAKGKFDDPILLNLLHKYQALVIPPNKEEHNPLTPSEN